MKVSREVGRQKQTQGLRNYPKFWVEITGLKNHIGDPRIGLSQFQKLSLPHEIKSTSFQVKISLNSTTTLKDCCKPHFENEARGNSSYRYTCSMNSYLTCDSPNQRSARRSFAPLQKSRRKYRSYARREALSEKIFMLTKKTIQYSVEIALNTTFLGEFLTCVQWFFWEATD